MATLIKIGHLFLNLDMVLCVEDLFTQTREDKLVVRSGIGPDQNYELKGKEAADLRTWLNSVATNLHAATDLDTAG